MLAPGHTAIAFDLVDGESAEISTAGRREPTFLRRHSSQALKRVYSDWADAEVLEDVVGEARVSIAATRSSGGGGEEGGRIHNGMGEQAAVGSYNGGG